MTQVTKRNLSIVAIVIASIAFGMILTADLGWMRQSNAQEAIRTTEGVVPTVTIPSFASVAERVMPAVVSITTTEVVNRNDRRRFEGVDPFDFFFPDPRRRPEQPEDEDRLQRSGGSGFIISADGYILTNDHVVAGATRVDVQYGENEIATAKVIGTDPATDLALIKIDVKQQLPTVRLGNSDAIRVGDWAIAIGNPLQFENTLTVGVVSAKNRNLGISQTTQSFENFIQTDAAINFGNSGGPLLNINGEAIGINTAIRGGAQNLGFATPINVAKRILPQLRDKGKVTRGYLGINVQDVDQRRRDAFNLPSASGAFVEAVIPGKPADVAGVQHGDVVVKVDNQEVRRTRDLIDYVSDQPPGSTVRLTVIRNGQQRTLSAKTAERPADTDDDRQAEGRGEGSNGPAQERERLGLSVQDMSPALQKTYGIGESVSGIVVTHVREVSPAGESNLQQGDIIIEANGQKVTSVTKFREVVEGLKKGQILRLYITRFGQGGRSQSFFALVDVP